MKKSLFLALAPTTLFLRTNLMRCKIRLIPKFHNPNGSGLVIESVSPDAQSTSPANLRHFSSGTTSEPGNFRNNLFVKAYNKEGGGTGRHSRYLNRTILISA